MPTQAEQRRLLTVKEVADEGRQHPHTIYRKIAAGEIPAVQLGGKGLAIRVDRRELESHLHQDPADPLRPVDDPAERAAPNSSSSRSAVEAVPLAGQR
jgi:excisionase family DNA binding protein